MIVCPVLKQPLRSIAVVLHDPRQINGPFKATAMVCHRQRAIPAWEQSQASLSQTQVSLLHHRQLATDNQKATALNDTCQIGA
jgi:hypothetical protein